MDNDLCPWCGAASRRQCELEEDMGSCPWEDSEAEPDPDRLREDRDERRRMEKEQRDTESAHAARISAGWPPTYLD